MLPKNSLYIKYTGVIAGWIPKQKHRVTNLFMHNMQQQSLLWECLTHEIWPMILQEEQLSKIYFKGVCEERIIMINVME
jgi:hypothetical protein